MYFRTPARSTTSTLQPPGSGVSDSAWAPALERRDQSDFSRDCNRGARFQVHRGSLRQSEIYTAPVLFPVTIPRRVRAVATADFPGFSRWCVGVLRFLDLFRIRFATARWRRFVQCFLLFRLSEQLTRIRRRSGSPRSLAGTSGSSTSSMSDSAAQAPNLQLCCSAAPRAEKGSPRYHVTPRKSGSTIVAVGGRGKPQGSADLFACSRRRRLCASGKARGA